jgi:hypothetical protein
MKKPTLVALLTLIVIPLHAADVSDLTFDASGDTITITDCDEAASGALVIPDTIEGKPVTSIGNSAFRNCGNLTAVTFLGDAPRVTAFNTAIPIERIRNAFHNA